MLPLLPVGHGPGKGGFLLPVVVAAHNHVLRRWLRSECPDPVREFDEAMHQVIGLFAPSASPVRADGSGTTIVACRTGQDIDTMLPALRRLLEESPGPIGGTSG